MFILKEIIIFHILPLLNHADIEKFRILSKEYNTCIKEYRKHLLQKLNLSKKNIDSMLQEALKDNIINYDRLKEFLDEECIISGSFLLKCILNGRFETNDIDVFIKLNKSPQLVDCEQINIHGIHQNNQIDYYKEEFTPYRPIGIHAVKIIGNLEFLLCSMITPKQGVELSDFEFSKNWYDGKTLYIKNINAVANKSQLNLPIGNIRDKARILKYRSRGFTIVNS